MVNQEGIRKTKKNKEKTRKQMYPKTTLVEETSQGIRGESLDIPFGAASDPSGVISGFLSLSMIVFKGELQ